MKKITPCLWFDSEAEEAARFYEGLPYTALNGGPQFKLNEAVSFQATPGRSSAAGSRTSTASPGRSSLPR